MAFTYCSIRGFLTWLKGERQMVATGGIGRSGTAAPEPVRNSEADSQFRRQIRRAFRNPLSATGLALSGFFLFLAIFSPLIVPVDPLAMHDGRIFEVRLDVVDEMHITSRIHAGGDGPLERFEIADGRERGG